MRFAKRKLFFLLSILCLFVVFVLYNQLPNRKVTVKRKKILNLNHLGIDVKYGDYRIQECKTKNYSIEDTETVSIIIAYYNESLLMLLKTIISLIRRTKDEFLLEIILIDDCSDDSYNFVNYFKNNQVSNKVIFNRNMKREGVIRSRNIGARMSSGKYLMFVDSHSEFGQDWLEPLLDRMKYQPYAAVSPALDVIKNEKNEKYKISSNYLKGGFDWSLRFKWIPMGEAEKEKRRLDETTPFLSPTTLGGTFLIRKKWFMDLGAFDDYMEIWGGESTDLSIKNWLCGGHIEVVPCSRIAHKFQNRRNFKYSTEIFIKNSKRIVESWFDEYKHIFYSNRPEAREMKVENLKIQKAVKRNLNCRDFKWYISNVYPDLLETQENVAFGTLRGQGNQCLEVTKKRKLKMKPCQNHSSNLWNLKKDTEHLTINDDDCVAAKNERKTKLFMEKCNINARHQKWTRQGAKLLHKETHQCLEHIRDDILDLSLCRPVVSQFWHFSFELQTQ